MYLILNQQRFDTFSTSEPDTIHYYGKTLFLSMNLDHFYYLNKRYNFKHTKSYFEHNVPTIATVSTIRGPIITDRKVHIFSLDNGSSIIIIQTKDLEDFSSNIYKLSSVIVFGMKFEPRLDFNII